MDKKLYGVGGWLKFYINCSLYLTPVMIGLGYLFTLASLPLLPAEMAQSMTVTSVTITTLLQVGLAFWRIKACLQLRADFSKKSVDNIKIFLVAAGIITFIVDLLLKQINFSPIELIIYFLFLLMEPVSWYWYFSTSQRVKNTYIDSRLKNSQHSNKKFFDKI